LCTHGDNLNFFGLNPEFKGVNGELLYNRMAQVYKNLGYADAKTPSWKLISDPSIVRAAQLTGATLLAEGQKTFTAATAEVQTSQAIATKPVTISFASGQSQLDENAKYIVDKEMVDLARAFSNARIRVSGNTDNSGNPATNKALSLRRAQSVVEYLTHTYNMPRNRFVIMGFGSDKPVADNNTEDGRARNRRTDFEIISGGE